LVRGVHPPADDGGDQHDHAGHADHGLDGRPGLDARLSIEAHPLFLEPDLALDAGAALRLLQANLLLADLRFLRLLDAPDAILFVAAGALDGLALGALGGFPGGALGVGALTSVVLLFLDSVVLDPSQLPKRKQNRILTTFGHGYPFTWWRARGDP